MNAIHKSYKWPGSLWSLNDFWICICWNKVLERNEKLLVHALGTRPSRGSWTHKCKGQFVNVIAVSPQPDNSFCIYINNNGSKTASLSALVSIGQVWGRWALNSVIRSMWPKRYPIYYILTTTTITTTKLGRLVVGTQRVNTPFHTQRNLLFSARHKTPYLEAHW